MRRSGPPGIAIEGLKWIGLAAACLWAHEAVVAVRYDIYGNRTGIAEARERRERELEVVGARVEEALDGCASEILGARRELEESIEGWQGEREDLMCLLEDRARRLEGSMLGRLSTRDAELEHARHEVRSGTEQIERLTARLSRDAREMKRRMILPTVQLKGNGTVGSGVIIYSEPQPDTGDGAIYTTFVLTAHHVVVEVLGDAADTGIVEEVRLLKEDDSSPDDVLRAKLVLFDRARDVALLRLDTARRIDPVAELMPRSDLAGVDVFTPAYAVGCPLGNRPLPTLGEISSKSKVVADQVFWMLNAPTFFGNSGGGIYLADGFRLIGVSSMIYTYGKTHPAVVPHMGLFVPLATIYRWLDAEGYSFIHRRSPIPREMLWKLAYTETDTPLPRNTSLRQE